MNFSRCIDERVPRNWYENALNRADFPALLERARDVSDSINGCRVSAGLSYSDPRYQAEFGNRSVLFFGTLNGNPSYVSLPSSQWQEYTDSFRWYLSPTTLGDIFTRLLPVGTFLGAGVGTLWTYHNYVSRSTALVAEGLRPLSFPIAGLVRGGALGLGLGVLSFVGLSLYAYYRTPSEAE